MTAQVTKRFWKVCPSCKTRRKMTLAQVYCNNACKQADYRQRVQDRAIESAARQKAEEERWRQAAIEARQRRDDELEAEKIIKAQEDWVNRWQPTERQERWKFIHPHSGQTLYPVFISNTNNCVTKQIDGNTCFVFTSNGKDEIVLVKTIVQEYYVKQRTKPTIRPDLADVTIRKF